VFASRPLVFLGVYSYGLYVFHHPLVVYAGSHDFGANLLPSVLGSRLPAQLVVTAVGMGLSVAVAMLSYHFYEKRFLALKRFFQPGSRPRVAPDMGAAHRATRAARP
jgi:peptidoglycan/LPS O-acetylase OafA/YrhL